VQHNEDLILVDALRKVAVRMAAIGLVWRMGGTVRAFQSQCVELGGRWESSTLSWYFSDKVFPRKWRDRKWQASAGVEVRRFSGTIKKVTQPRPAPARALIWLPEDSDQYADQADMRGWWEVKDCIRCRNGPNYDLYLAKPSAARSKVISRALQGRQVVQTQPLRTA